MGDIPEWAWVRAYRLSWPNEISSLWQFKSLDCGKAFARYISEHEEPPLDPLEAEAARLVHHEWAGEIGNFALAALRRGMELAQKDQPQ